MPDSYVLGGACIRECSAKTSHAASSLVVAVITLNCHASIKPRKKLLRYLPSVLFTFARACSPALLPADFVMKTIYTRYPVKLKPRQDKNKS